jgi:N-acetylglucosaminyldiphosphoundecaprenol N-acetyl-beta-D-mannosaminyltransferase
MQQYGLEWLYRLGQEPQRLFARYIVHDVPFAVQLLGHAVIRRWELAA